jgi:hypothetical protein
LPRSAAGFLPQPGPGGSGWRHAVIVRPAPQGRALALDAQNRRKYLRGFSVAGYYLFKSFDCANKEVEELAKKYEVRIEAERFIHNDLSNCSWDFQQRTKKKFENGEMEGVYHDMMASLVFSAFSIEAKLNFVGWKVLGDGWPERANIREKVNLLNEVLSCGFDWGARPLQTVAKLKRFRDTLAHGKPEIIDEVCEVDVEPSVWDALKSQWEESVTPSFVDICRDDEHSLWKTLLEKAEIGMEETITSGGHHLSALIEG